MIQAGNPPPEASLRDGERIVKIHRTSAFHAILYIQYHLRGHVADCRGDWGNRGGVQMGDGIVTCQYEDRSPFVRRRSSASASQGAYSSIRCGGPHSHAGRALQAYEYANTLDVPVTLAESAAERFTVCRLAARSAALRSVASRTILYRSPPWNPINTILNSRILRRVPGGQPTANRQQPSRTGSIRAQRPQGTDHD